MAGRRNDAARAAVACRRGRRPGDEIPAARSTSKSASSVEPTSAFASLHGFGEALLRRHLQLENAAEMRVSVGGRMEAEEKEPRRSRRPASRSGAEMEASCVYIDMRGSQRSMELWRSAKETASRDAVYVWTDVVREKNKTTLDQFTSRHGPMFAPVRSHVSRNTHTPLALSRSKEDPPLPKRGPIARRRLRRRRRRGLPLSPRSERLEQLEDGPRPDGEQAHKARRL